MKYAYKAITVIWIVVIFAAVGAIPASATRVASTDQIIPTWDMRWAGPGERGTIHEGLSKDLSWTTVTGDEVLPDKPERVTAAWIRLEVPQLYDEIPAIYFQNIYGKHITIYKDNMIMYESYRPYSYELNKVLLPIQQKDSGKELYIWMDSRQDKVGISGKVVVGDHRELMGDLIWEDILDIVLGGAFILIATVLAFCSFFLFRPNLLLWISLCIVVLSVGVLIVTYSPFLFTFYREGGKLYLQLFDISLYMLSPALALFFEQILDDKRYIRWARIWLTGYSLFCMVFMVINLSSGDRYYDSYFVVSVLLLGVQLIALLLLLFSSVIRLALKGSKEATIMSMGFACFCFSSVGELLLYYVRQGQYEFFLWKWGVVGFILSLITILGRRLTEKHRQVVQYSRELEMFNNELQRSEKMDIISDLAASVAHEVRNPLQVTRGFLQLISGQEKGKNKGYLDIALGELDRASSIITDFLTFAKPEPDHVKTLQLLEEFRHIEAIISPMANLQGDRIYLDIPSGLNVRGNSSKLKQAFINIIKNSIEALDEEGQINIWAYQEGKEVVIHIRDNGEGMDSQTLSRLGEPYFSNKTKGTGLGMMVTFRIIEAMGGSISFTSSKGVGTEAVVRFPSAG
ncbi:sensor histidine kinase [Paenibacillus massiliensis]|uniref:sensor histidine kinase n=1 Tax=Paenibacillus massiliensis TaxID=225917 RepID=UPI0004709CAC|nr:sensor histidine kinase [Paenibacillus massiliensis]